MPDRRTKDRRVQRTEALLRGALAALIREKPYEDIASTFVLVLNWWVESDNPLSAREVDGLFRELVEPSLARALA